MEHTAKIKSALTFIFCALLFTSKGQVKEANEIEFKNSEFRNSFATYVENGYIDTTTYSINVFVFNVDEKGIVNHITHTGNLDSAGLKFVVDRIKRSELYWVKSIPSASNKWFILPFIAGDPRIDGKQPSLEEINRLVTIILFEIKNRMIPGVDNVRLLHTRQSLYGNQVIM
jgi:hypothetical protein